MGQGSLFGGESNEYPTEKSRKERKPVGDAERYKMKPGTKMNTKRGEWERHEEKRKLGRVTPVGTGNV